MLTMTSVIPIKKMKAQVHTMTLTANANPIFLNLNITRFMNINYDKQIFFIAT